ncbi:hypothetical protein GCM10010191_51600 [Actinomadura vinacea]|uniref:HTH cro/C1-type domain-containing protein n=1 Tax=Actinomadura vinacea TaxID=115336 RepID=A0ABP5WMY7_9ACTN
MTQVSLRLPLSTLARELRAYREAAGLTRPELAKKIGYTPQWIGQIEAGDGESLRRAGSGL